MSYIFSFFCVLIGEIVSYFLVGHGHTFPVLYGAAIALTAHKVLFLDQSK